MSDWQVNLSVKSWIFDSGRTHILSVIFIKTFHCHNAWPHSVPEKKVVSVTLWSVMYNNNGGSPNKYDCQFLKCIFYAYEGNFTK